jgi:hypothetical protein
MTLLPLEPHNFAHLMSSDAPRPGKDQQTRNVVNLTQLFSAVRNFRFRAAPPPVVLRNFVPSLEQLVHQPEQKCCEDQNGTANHCSFSHPVEVHLSSWVMR